MTVSNLQVAEEVGNLRASIEKKLENLQVGSSFGLEVVVDSSTKYGFEVVTRDSTVFITDLDGNAGLYVTIGAKSFLMAREGEANIATLLSAGEIKIRGDISQLDNFQNISLS
ncbi:MAG: hypothetical protein M0Z45_08135 [Actinomycetota bacterium]|nr:hypothetical protein [Actinomycetota bacterium]